MPLEDMKGIIVDCAIRMSEDRKLWRSSRPSLRCQPLLGGVAIKQGGKVQTIDTQLALKAAACITADPSWQDISIRGS